MARVVPKHGTVDCMKSKPYSKMHTTMDQDDIDSNEMIAREMVEEGLSGNPEVDTWELNSRIDHHHFEVHNRARHARRGLVELH
jgi:hypothetical protein